MTQKRSLRHFSIHRRGEGVQPRELAPTLIWVATAAVLAFAVVYPSVVLILSSFKTPQGYGFGNYLAVFQDKAIGVSVLNTVKVVFPSTLFSTALGVFLAWAVIRTDVPGRGLWRSLLAIPYLIPPFIGAISWTFLLGPVGFFNQLWQSAAGVSQPLVDLYSLGGMVFVMSIYRYAVPYVVVLPAMKKVNAAVEEAARVSGASPWRTLRDVTLPLLTPSILGATLLVFMFILADFGVSAVLGAPNQIRLMTTQIYAIINRPDLPGNLQLAAAYSLLLALFGLLGLALYNRVLAAQKYVVVSGKSAPVQPTPLGKGKWGLFAFLLVVFSVTTLAPILATLTTSLTKTFGLPFGPENVTLRNFSRLLTIRNIRRAFGNSLFLSSASGVIVTVVALAVAYVAIRGGIRKFWGVRLMQTMVTVPYAVPGTIIALAMILAFAQPLPVTGIRLYGTIWILLVAYVARFMNLGYNNISGAITQIDGSLEEASRISGASHLKAFSTIMLPLLKPSLYGSFFLVVAPTLSEITLSSLLWSVGSETVGTVVFSTQEEGKILLTASLAVVLVTIVVVLNYLVRWFSKDDMGI